MSDVTYLNPPYPNMFVHPLLPPYIGGRGREIRVREEGRGRRGEKSEEGGERREEGGGRERREEGWERREEGWERREEGGGRGEEGRGGGREGEKESHADFFKQQQQKHI